MFQRTLLTGAIFCALGMPSFAFAALGDTVNSVQGDQITMRAAMRPSSVQANYSIHEIATPSGTLVREYTSKDGVVFAVAWKGPVLPDLRQLLGKYFSQYSEAPTNQQVSHRHAQVVQPGLVVQSNGHLRAFYGKAYLPQLLPQGVTVNELQ